MATATRLGAPTPRLGGWPWWAAAAAFALVQAALLLHTAWDKSDTVDEPYYLATAVQQWSFADFGRTCDAPTLPRWGFALALRVADPALFDPGTSGGRDPLWSRPLPRTRLNLWAARCATAIVTVAGGLWLWAAARRFGPFPALVTHALWCLSPTVLAQGSLATLDAWVTAALCLVILLMVRFVETPTPGRAALLGAALGLAAACKVTALAAAPVAVGIVAWVVVRRRPPETRTLGRLARIALSVAYGFLLALWAVYLFEVGRVDPAHPCGHDRGLALRPFGPLPFPSWFEGLIVQILHGRAGHLSYLAGESAGEGWWWFYLACLALKTTVGAQALALFLLAARGLARRARGGLLLDVALLALPALLLTAMSLGKTQNGIRYVLPLFPCLMLWAARAVELAAPAFGRAGIALLSLILGVGTVESLAVHPHHLMFFNAWAGGPVGGPRYLVHGDDWGQDQRRLGEWQQANHPWRLYYTYYNGQPRHWGISYEDPSCEPRPGFYALHAVEVHRPKRLPAGCLDWLTVEPPDERLGYSIYLYQVNKDRIERLAAERRSGAFFWRSGR
jgi:hypothetical protein